MSRTELVEHLYDQDFDRDFNTIEVFVGRLRKKLDADLIQTVRGLGYCLDDPNASAKIAPRIQLACRRVSSRRRRCGRCSALVAGRLCAVERLSRLGRRTISTPTAGRSRFAGRRGRPDPSGAIVLEPRFLERRFQRVYSGDYWQIVPVGGGDADRSRTRCSIATIRFTDSAPAKDGLIWGHGDGPGPAASAHPVAPHRVSHHRHGEARRQPRLHVLRRRRHERRSTGASPRSTARCSGRSSFWALA